MVFGLRGSQRDPTGGGGCGEAEGNPDEKLLLAEKRLEEMRERLAEAKAEGARLRSAEEAARLDFQAAEKALLGAETEAKFGKEALVSKTSPNGSDIPQSPPASLFPGKRMLLRF